MSSTVPPPARANSFVIGGFESGPVRSGVRPERGGGVRAGQGGVGTSRAPSLAGQGGGCSGPDRGGVRAVTSRAPSPAEQGGGCPGRGVTGPESGRTGGGGVRARTGGGVRPVRSRAPSPPGQGGGVRS
jgi:hypothetical protein